MASTPSLESVENSLESFRKELTESAHIVLIEEDEEVRDRLDLALQKRGVTVHAFENAAFLLEWLGTEQVAVGIVNLGLTGVSGFDLMDMLRKKDPLVELVALAANPDATTAVACLEKGAQDLFSIPIEREELLVSRVSVAIERWRRASIDNRITEQFRTISNSLLRKDDTKHKGAMRVFTKRLADHKKYLTEAKEILVVSANSYAGGRTKSFLEGEGYSVSVASTVSDAEVLASENEFRLLLSDAEISDGSAFDVYEKVCKFHPDIEFLVVSSANEVDIALQAMAKGARDCILKPHEGLEAIQLKVKRAFRLQDKHAKHQRLVDELRKLCSGLVAFDAETKAGGLMIKVDPGKSQATLDRFLGELAQEEEKRLRRDPSSIRFPKKPASPPVR